MSVEDTLNQDSPPILSDAKDDDNTIDMISSSSEARSKAIAFNPNLSIPSTKIETLLNLKKSPVSVSSSSSSSLSSGSKKSTTAETKDSDDNDVQLQNYQLLEKQEQLRKLMSRLNIDGEPSAASSKFSSYFGGDNDEDGGDDDDDFGNDEEDKAKREEIFAKVTNLSTWTSTPEQDKRAKYSELFEALLNLKDPVTVINRGFIAFLSLPGACDTLISFLTRAPKTKTVLSFKAVMEDTKPFLKERPKENNLATRQAYLVMKILNSLVDDPHFSEFFTSNLDNIITSLFDIFDPQAEGSFYHFTSVLESLLKARAGDVLDVIFALKQFEVHLFRFVHYLHHSAVAHALQLILQSTCRPPQRRRFVESLRQANFLTTSQKLIIHTDELISSLYTVSFLKLSSEFAIDPFARSLFLDSTRLKSFVTELSKVCCSPDLKLYNQSQNAAEVLLSIYQISQRNPITELPIGIKPTMSLIDLNNQKKHVLDIYTEIVPSLCEKLKTMSEKGPELANTVSHLKRKVPVNGDASTTGNGTQDGLFAQQTVPFTMLRLNLIKIITEILSSIVASKTEAVSALSTTASAAAVAAASTPFNQDGEKVLTLIPPTTWKQLVNLLLEHRHNNVYHSVFFKLLASSLQFNHELSLKAIFSNTKLLTRLIQHYKLNSKDTSLRGYILLILNYVRLTAASHRSLYITGMLQNHAEWASFLPQLLEDTLKQQKYIMSTSDILRKIGSTSIPFPYSGPAIASVPKPSTPAPTPAAASFLNKKLMAAKTPSATATTENSNNNSDVNLLNLGSTFAQHLGFFEQPPSSNNATTTTTTSAVSNSGSTSSPAGKSGSKPAAITTKTNAAAATTTTTTTTSTTPPSPTSPTTPASKNKHKKKKKKSKPANQATGEGAKHDSDSGDDE